MISKKLAGVSAAGVGAATAVTALLLGTASGSATAEFDNSAYGFAATGTLAGEAFAPTPFVEFTGGEPAEDELLALPPGPDALVSTLKVRADAEGSSAEGILLGMDGSQLGLLRTTCADKAGEVQLLSVDGEDMAPEQFEDGLDASPLLKVEFDRQTENEDGTLTVDGMVVTLLPATEDLGTAVEQDDLLQLDQLAPEALQVPDFGQLQAASEGEQPTLGELEALLETLNGGLQLPIDSESLLEIVITSATCGPVEKDETEAPVPTPIETNLPVTH